MKPVRILALLLVIALSLLTSIQAQSGKEVTIAWPQEPGVLNPMYSPNTYTGYTISLFLASAWSYNSNLEPVPVLVTEIPSLDNGGISEDNTTFTLKLKEGLTWSDGDPLDSADFLFTYEMYTNSLNAPVSRAPYELMTSVEAPDALTVVVTFPEAYAPWLSMFGQILPEHVLRPVFDADGTLDTAEFNQAPTVSSGPYIFQEWNVGNFMRFTANPNYALGQPLIETMFVRFFGDDESYVNSLIANEIQLATFFDYSYVPRVEEAGIEVQVLPAGYNEGWYFNVGPDGHPALQDVNVRKAASLAFDRFAITEDLLNGATYPGSSFWEGTPFADPDLEAVPFDPAEANRLLDEAGWVDSNSDGTRDKDGVELVLRYVTNQRSIRLEIQPIVQQQLGDVGIGVELFSYPSDQFFAGYADGGPIATGQYDIAQWSTAPGGFPDPNTRAFMCAEIPSDEEPSGSNWTFFCDEELSALFEEQAATTDFNQRVEIFQEIDRRMYESYVWVSVWFDADTWSTREPLTNANVNGVSPFWDVQNWDVITE
ncbi:MAG: peptide ABC transporter substrate-binding protein [Anaerolineae bacterium]|jgi:peptide/nickel transport system substrate-binding protein|nr:peptide ABC transporter substrate-binding protein [Anaerolineae bacterium]